VKNTLAILLLATALTGRAQAQRGIDMHLYSPAVDGYGLFATERAQTAPRFTWGFLLSSDFAQHPFRLDMYDAVSMQPTRQSIIDYQIVTHLGGYFGLTDWLQLAFDLPMSAQAFTSAYGTYGAADDPHIVRSGFYAADPYTNIPPSDGGPLDMRIALKGRFFRRSGFALGAKVELTLPFGDDSAFLGDSGVTVRPVFIADFTRGPVTIAANVGAILRQSTTVLDPHDVATKVADPRVLLDSGHELIWSAGIGYRFVHWAQLLAEINGYTPLTGVVKDHTADVIGGLRFFPMRRVAVSVAAGANVFSGALRHDEFRVLAGLSWSPAEITTSTGGSDIDGDGVPDALDQCPSEPEDRDGFQDDDGCPEPDNDGDGIPDAQDKCPNEPEDRDGFQDDDGCPDADNDGDGIPDAADKCPNEPETRNGIDDDDGCPDSGGRIVTAEPGAVVIAESILFDANQSALPKSAAATLDKVAERLRARPDVRTIRLEGRAEASEKKPQPLSQARAEAIRAALIQRGIEPARLQAVGYGASRPFDKGKSARNRSVEFIVVTQ
jgi:outer membrane protein OmpA-like peptidoglycan-associated protein